MVSVGDRGGYRRFPPRRSLRERRRDPRHLTARFHGGILWGVLGAVILGGAMNFGGRQNPVGRQFLQRVEDEFKSRAFAVVAHNTLIDFASLGGDAGYIGAAGIGRSSLRSR